jgi:hypothetical protein
MLAHGTVPPEGGAFAAGSAAFVSTVMASESLQQGMKEKGYVQNTIRDCMIINGFQRKHWRHSLARRSVMRLAELW